MTTIILNPEEATLLDYNENWKDIMTYESYLSVLSQRETYLSNQKGYEASK